MLFKNWMIIALQYCIGFCCSVQFSCSVVSLCDPMDCKHTRPPCPSPTPAACSNSCLLSWWCHPTISSSGVPVSSCPQSFPASGLFQWVTCLHQVAFVTPWTVARQAPLSMGFSRQEYWSGLPALLQGIIQTQGLNLPLLLYVLMVMMLVILVRMPHSY